MSRHGLLQAGRAELVMDADVSRSIVAEIEDEASLTCDKWENGVMDISFTEQPLWRDAAMSTATQAVSLATGTWQTIDLSKVFSARHGLYNAAYAGCDEYGQRGDFGFSHQIQGQTRKAEANAAVWRWIFAHGRPELASGWRKPVCGLRWPEHDFGALRGRFSFCISERSEHRDYERIGSSGFGDGERTGEVVVIEDSDLQSRYDAHRNHPPCFQGGLQANVQRPAYGEF